MKLLNYKAKLAIKSFLSSALILTGLKATADSDKSHHKCLLFDEMNVGRVVVPCQVFMLNNTLTFAWQVAGRGIGTRVVAEAQWDEYLASVLERCASDTQCLQGNGQTVVMMTVCPVTDEVQPLTMDPELYLPLSTECRKSDRSLRY
jgi:hypothetical protein